jgi:hypothetical protein
MPHFSKCVQEIEIFFKNFGLMAHFSKCAQNFLKNIKKFALCSNFQYAQKILEKNLGLRPKFLNAQNFRIKTIVAYIPIFEMCLTIFETFFKSLGLMRPIFKMPINFQKFVAYAPNFQNAEKILKKFGAYAPIF